MREYFQKQIEIQKKKTRDLENQERAQKERFFEQMRDYRPIELAYALTAGASERMTELEIKLSERITRLERLALVHNALILGAGIYLFLWRH